PFRSNVPPPTLTAPALGRARLPPSRNVPPLTVVPPEKELFGLVSVNVPVPALTRPPAPEIGPEIGLLSDPLLTIRVGELRTTGRADHAAERHRRAAAGAGRGAGPVAARVFRGESDRRADRTIRVVAGVDCERRLRGLYPDDVVIEIDLAGRIHGSSRRNPQVA